MSNSNLLLYKKIVKFLSATLQQRLPKKVAVISINKSQSQKLNRRYRKKNKPTNVLSFYYGPDYGEVLVSPEIIRQEAKVLSRTYKYQMTRMILHGMLHLAGIHHEKSGKDAKKSERLEQKLLKKLGPG